LKKDSEGGFHVPYCYPIFDPCFDIFSEKSKNREKHWKSKKIHFLIYLHHFKIFSIVSKEFKFSKIMGTHSTFNALFLKIIDFPHWVDVDIACFEKIQKK
jgi:hypothetical protein